MTSSRGILTATVAILIVATGLLWLSAGGGTGGGSSRLASSTVATATTPLPAETTAAAPATIAPPPASPATPALAPAPPSATKPKPRLVVAWQPSHQDDTGPGPWHEYVICSDIVDRTMKLLPAEIRSVKAWDTSHGLFGSNNYPKPINPRAFDEELKVANAADARLFISIHNDSEAPSGVLGECMPGDDASAEVCDRFVEILSERLGLHDRGVRQVRLYSLDPVRNDAPLRILLEIGDNERDRDLLSDPAGRQRIAEALAKAVREVR